VKRAALIGLGALAVPALAGLGAFAWWYHSISVYAQTPFGSAEEKLLEIAPGARMKEVALQLESAGVITDARRFEWLARRLRRDRQIKTGEYGFAGPLLPEKVLETIALGRVKLHHCTIPEGLRVEEISALLAGCGYGRAEEFLALARDESVARREGVRGSSLEGYLFPDTYSFPRGPRPEAVLHKMVERFFEELRKAQARALGGVPLDAHGTATLASIIEKETGAPEERPHISCVFHNRLKKHMKLETDPTVIYAMLRHAADRPVGDDPTSARAIAAGHRDLDDPYNTYRHKGLPPGPIASAGAAALEAALHPTECDDLFFVACGGGTHRFCPDFACHDRNVDHCQRGKP
jgi:UPF0755 protein